MECLEVQTLQVKMTVLDIGQTINSCVISKYIIVEFFIEQKWNSQIHFKANYIVVHSYFWSIEYYIYFSGSCEIRQRYTKVPRCEYL